MGRVEYGNRFWFGEPGEEEEVRVLSEGMLDIIVSDLQLPRGNDGDRVAEVFHERSAPRRKACLIHTPRVPTTANPGFQLPVFVGCGPQIGRGSDSALDAWGTLVAGR